MTQQEFMYQYQQKVNEIWSNMSVDEYGGVYMNAQNQKIKYENLKYLNKDGKSFIFDSSSQKLYDQMFNYYHNGNYYNPFGQLVQEVSDPNIIDGTFREITEPQRSKFGRYDDIFVHYGHEQFDKQLFQPIKNKNFVKPTGGLWSSPVNTDRGWKDFLQAEDWRLDDLEKSIHFKLKKDANILNIESVADLDGLPTDTKTGYLDYEQLAKQYDGMYVDLSKGGRDLHWNEKIYGYDVDSLLVFNPDIVEEVNSPTPKKPKYKAARGPKLKEKPKPEPSIENVKVVEQTAKSPTPKSKPKPAKVPKTKALPKKTLSGGGKIALGIGFIAASVAGATVVAEGIENKKEKKNKKAHSLNRTTNSQEYDNSYAQQMAADISSYRYGKHMTGFVNH